MNKIGKIILITIGVFLVYMLMLVVSPILTSFASTANTTMAASSNLTNYPGAGEAVLAAPIVLWWAPAIICMIIIVIYLKRGGG